MTSCGGIVARASATIEPSECPRLIRSVLDPAPNESGVWVLGPSFSLCCCLGTATSRQSGLEVIPARVTCPRRRLREIIRSLVSPFPLGCQAHRTCNAELTMSLIVSKPSGMQHSSSWSEQITQKGRLSRKRCYTQGLHSGRGNATKKV
jgi:hypothetical protein